MPFPGTALRTEGIPIPKESSVAPLAEAHDLDSGVFRKFTWPYPCHMTFAGAKVSAMPRLVQWLVAGEAPLRVLRRSFFYLISKAVLARPETPSQRYSCPTAVPATARSLRREVKVSPATVATEGKTVLVGRPVALPALTDLCYVMLIKERITSSTIITS